MSEQPFALFNRRKALCFSLVIYSVTFFAQYLVIPIIDGKWGHPIEVLSPIIPWGVLGSILLFVLLIKIWRLPRRNIQRIEPEFLLFFALYLFFLVLVSKFIVNQLPIFDRETYRVNTLASCAFGFLLVWLILSNRSVLLFVSFFSAFVAICLLTDTGRIQIIYCCATLALLAIAFGLLSLRWTLFLLVGATLIVVGTGLVITSAKNSITYGEMLANPAQLFLDLTFGRINQVALVENLVRLNFYLDGEVGRLLLACFLEQKLCWGNDLGQAMGVVDRVEGELTGVGPSLFGSIYLWLGWGVVCVYPMLTLAHCWLSTLMLRVSIPLVGFLPVLVHVSEDFPHAWFLTLGRYFFISLLGVGLWKMWRFFRWTIDARKMLV